MPTDPTPILTITLNPALDLATEVAGVRPGPKLRCTEPVTDPGGGGINVARAICALGGKALAFVAVGGSTGARLTDLLQRDGVPVHAFAIAGETRQSIAVTDSATGGQYRFVLPGPTWNTATTRASLAALGPLIAPGGIVVLSGSQPPGVPDDYAADLAAICAAHGARLIIDTSGAPLAALNTRPANPDVLRMDAAEAEGLAGRALISRAETAAFAETLRKAGVARAVIIARGADGSALACDSGLWHAARPIEKVVSAVGAGDSFVAGFALALAGGAALPQALKRGAAAAAATCLTPATRLCTAEDTQKAFENCSLESL